jgi:hypothetical protein
VYALNAQPAAAADMKGGVIRSLNPTYSAPTFETVLSGLEDAVTLNGMSMFGNQLWVIDTKNMRLMTFVDTLTLPTALTTPVDKAPGLDTINLNLKWEAVDSAGGYEGRSVITPAFPAFWPG